MPNIVTQWITQPIPIVGAIFEVQENSTVSSIETSDTISQKNGLESYNGTLLGHLPATNFTCPKRLCGVHGTCVGVSEKRYRCECDPGWHRDAMLERDNCLLRRERECRQEMCHGHGKCRPHSIRPICDCNSPYTGYYCEERYETNVQLTGHDADTNLQTARAAFLTVVFFLGFSYTLYKVHNTSREQRRQIDQLSQLTITKFTETQFRPVGDEPNLEVAKQIELVRNQEEKRKLLDAAWEETKAETDMTASLADEDG